MRKILSIIMLLVATFAGILVVHHMWNEAAPTHLLQEYLNQDLATLAAENKLPAEWKKIRDIEIEYQSEDAKSWKTEFVLPIERDPSGGFRLEVDLDSWDDSGEYGAVVQFHLVNIEQSNTVWELGRTYKLGKREIKGPSETDSSPDSPSSPK